MRRLLALVLVCAVVLASRSARAADPDPWFGRDKALHFGVSAGIAAGTYAGAAALFEARGHALLVASGVTMAAGTAKEMLDLAGWGHPSWKDFAWDAVGCLAGLAFAWSIDLVVRGISPAHPLLREPASARTSLAFFRF